MKRVIIFQAAKGATLNSKTFNSSKLASLMVAHLVCTVAMPGDSSIPWSEIGARATEQYSGNGLGIKRVNDNEFILQCQFQKLTGRVNRSGLSIKSAEEGAATAMFQVTADALGRDGGAMIVLPSEGDVQIQGKDSVRFVRLGVTEEYSVSADGVRQDFIIYERPKGQGNLRVELSLHGALARPAMDGAHLRLNQTGRHLTYNRLKAGDSKGSGLTS